MSNLATNLLSGFFSRLSKVFASPYRVFDISWIQEKILKHDSRKNRTSHLYEKKYRVFFTDRGAFLLSVREIFYEKVYQFKPQQVAPRILDCGGHIGMSALFLLKNYPGCRLTVFEPDADNFALLQKNIHTWGFTQAELTQAAVWTNKGTVSFQANHDMSSSIADSPTSGKDLQSVNSIRLKDYLVEKIDFLKMDIEGAEYEVLLDCGDSLSQVENMFIEYHGNFEDSKKLTQLLALFTEVGFQYYLTEAGRIHTSPFQHRDRGLYQFDQQLNIFCFRN